MNALWVIIVFFLGAVTGALVLAIYHAATIARTRQAFEADLDKLLEAHSNPMAGSSAPPVPEKAKNGKAA